MRYSLRRAQFISFAVAAICAMAAVLLAKEWVIGVINDQASRFVQMAQPQKMDTVTVVSATRDLPVGTELTKEMLHEVKWPAEAVPAGFFPSIEEFFASEPRRVVLSAMRPNEAVVAAKVTPAGQRASLSAMLRPGMKAATVRVNDVIGVAGFILPGDRVDILMTRDTSKSGGTVSDEQIFSDVILQDVRVLAVDQLTNEGDGKAVPAQSVTVEVSIENAQKLALAATVGNLSLALRELKAQSAPAEVGRITVADLAVEKTAVDAQSLLEGTVTPLPNLIPSQSRSVAEEAVNADPAHDRVTVTVIRATKEQEYRVPPR